MVAGIEISFTLTSKSGGEEDDEFANLIQIAFVVRADCDCDDC